MKAASSVLRVIAGMFARKQSSYASNPGPSHTVTAAPVSNGLDVAAIDRALGAMFCPRGATPKDWGMSQSCAKMVRKNSHRKALAK